MKIKSNLLDRLRMRDYVKLTVILMRWNGGKRSPPCMYDRVRLKYLEAGNYLLLICSGKFSSDGMSEVFVRSIFSL